MQHAVYCTCGNWYGVGTGVLVGLAYGILQFIQEPYVLLFSKCAVIIFWHLQLLVWQDCQKEARTA